MPSFSARSRERLATCHPDLIRLMNEAISTAPSDMDFTILCGFRNKSDQDAAVAAGNSTTPWPRSRHNATPSQAVDIAPYPVDWNDLGRFRKLSAHIKATAARLGIPIEWGGDWKSPVDMPHYQLRR